MATPQENIIWREFRIPRTGGALTGVVDDASDDPVPYPIWKFKATDIASVDLFGWCTAAFTAAKNVEVLVAWHAATASSGDIRLEALIRKITRDASHTNISTLNITGHVLGSVTSTLSASGTKYTTATIAISGHGLVAGDTWHCRLRRNPPHAADTMSGFANVGPWVALREAV